VILGSSGFDSGTVEEEVVAALAMSLERLGQLKTLWSLSPQYMQRPRRLLSSFWASVRGARILEASILMGTGLE
jgi:hypothetical protein